MLPSLILARANRDYTALRLNLGRDIWRGAESGVPTQVRRIEILDGFHADDV